MERFRRITLAQMAVAMHLVLAPAVFAQEGADTLRARLTGEAEAGGGDPDGRGTATIQLAGDMQRLCYQLEVSDITDATAAHVHRAPAGRDGPPVITLSAPTNGSSSDCLDVDTGLLADLRQNPGAFYVNVHNPEFPGGAVRGQLGG